LLAHTSNVGWGDAFSGSEEGAAMANRFPYFPFYPNDWLASSKRAVMTLSEQGAYFNLLCHYWESGCSGLETSDLILQGLAGIRPSDRKAPRMETLLSCFIVRDGKLHNERLEKVYLEAVSYSDARKAAGVRGAESRWHSHAVANGKPDAKAVANDDSSHSPSPSPSEEKKEGLTTTLSEPPKTVGSDLVVEVVELWNRTRKPAEKIRITPQRKAKVEARLKDKFTPEQLRDVVVRCRDSEWHQGKNDRGWKAPGPEWVLHSTERVEQWLAKRIDPKSEAAKYQGNSKPCGRCNGIGMVYSKQADPRSPQEEKQVDVASQCSVCGGRGKVPA
jgi:uncharacterized protein YdaU (DUF1376 family)